MTKDIKDLGLDEEKLIMINELYIESRYPGELGLMPHGMLSSEQAKELLEYTKEVKKIIRKEL